MNITKGGSVDGILITEEHVKEGLQRSHILYDRAGEYLIRVSEMQRSQELIASMTSVSSPPFVTSCSSETVVVLKFGLKVTLPLQCSRLTQKFLRNRVSSYHLGSVG